MLIIELPFSACLKKAGGFLLYSMIYGAILFAKPTIVLKFSGNMCNVKL